MLGEFLGRALPKIGAWGKGLGTRAAGAATHNAIHNTRFLKTAGGFSALGLGASVATGDWGYALWGAGVGLGGGISGGLGRGPFKRIVGAGAVGFGAGLSGLGSAAVPIAVGGTLAVPWAAKGYASGIPSIPGLFKSYGQLMTGNAYGAARTIGGLAHPYWGAFAGGTMIGMGWGGIKSALGGEDAVDGFFPGGINYMPPGRGGMSSDPMSTAGLTLALHKHSRAPSRMM